ncbi:MAG: hypothetical protein PHU14_16660 [Methylovulum sp.]|jgi:hypothetical protein|nr:hypothetical protein [Methylovulum sp.]
MTIKHTSNKISLRWELGVALLLKILLLTGLWFLLHRWPERPVVKPDIAAHFALPVSSSNPENHYDR